MKYDFQDFVVLVTGAASGVVLAAAKAFADSGAFVMLSDFDTEKLQPLVAQITNTGGKARPSV